MVFLGLHGVMVLASLGGRPWQWAGVGLVLLVGLAGLAWTAASAYARMANLAVEAELELGRRDRLGRALLDALADPAAVLDAQGGIVAVNQAGAAGSAAGQALGKVGERYHPAPGGAGSSGVTVTPLAEGGAIVTHRPAPPATG